MTTILTCIAICFAKTLEVVLQSINSSLIARGERKMAIPLVFAECALWGLVIYSLWNVIGTNGWLMLAYCAGYGVGMLLGSAIESKMAMGTSSIQMISNKEHIETLRAYLINNKIGFTILPGEGAFGESFVVILILARKDVKKTINAIEKLCDNKIFVVTSEVSKFTGGYGIKKNKGAL
jgi:uncharacterized protein YebE (UPF0316 family)